MTEKIELKTRVSKFLFACLLILIAVYLGGELILVIVNGLGSFFRRFNNDLVAGSINSNQTKVGLGLLANGIMGVIIQILIFLVTIMLGILGVRWVTSWMKQKSPAP